MAACVDLDNVFIPRPQIRFRLIAGQGLVINQEVAEALVLNEVGAQALDLLDGRRSVAEIINLLDGEYHADHEILEQDVRTYLAELQQAGIVEPVTPPGAG